ncbi:MAG: RIP metalloprotease RseP [Gammaproteobacteria bacterium]|nr:MAG: RIP metalloprotease RseP [Gammaproteobacteria bacterium]
MSEFLGSIWWLLVALGLLITFHEFGHFWVARRMGVRVLKFSVGFGKKIWSRKGRDGTEYVIAAVPLGGYVKMLDEREGEVEDCDLKEAFNRKSVWARIAIVIAGPAFNLVFTLLAFWLMFLVGLAESRPVIGEVSGIAASAGLEPDDRILSIDGEVMDTWSHAILGLITPALDREKVVLTVEQTDGSQRQVLLDLSQLDSSFKEEQALQDIGITPWRAKVPAVVGEVTPGSPAYQAGFKPGDRIVSVAGETVPDWAWVGALVQKYGSAGEPLTVTVERAGGNLDLSVRPEKKSSGTFSSRLILGITNRPPDPQMQARAERAYFLHKYNLVDGFIAASSEMARLTRSTLGLLGRMLTGTASVRNLSGPISIARFANSAANAGLSSFLFFLGAISLSLGILNLLPIPVLDGGHLLYYLIELVKGSPVSEQVQANGQYIGLLALFGLMGIAFLNDILRLVG